MNAGMALFEIIFANTRPLPWIHLPFNILFLACYLAVAYITHATQGFYRKFSPFFHILCLFTYSRFVYPSVQFLGPTDPTRQGRSIRLRHRYCWSHHLRCGSLPHSPPCTSLKAPIDGLIFTRGYWWMGRGRQAEWPHSLSRLPYFFFIFWHSEMGQSSCGFSSRLDSSLPVLRITLSSIRTISYLTFCILGSISSMFHAISWDIFSV